jgi:hypothetical protein
LPFAAVFAQSGFSPLSFQSRLIGVGHEKDSLSQVGCPELPSGKARPLRVIPHFGQVSENSSDRCPVPSLPFPGEEGGDVLHDDVAGS